MRGSLLFGWLPSTCPLQGPFGWDCGMVGPSLVWEGEGDQTYPKSVNESKNVELERGTHLLQWLAQKQFRKRVLDLPAVVSTRHSSTSKPEVF